MKPLITVLLLSKSSPEKTHTLRRLLARLPHWELHTAAARITGCWGRASHRRLPVCSFTVDDEAWLIVGGDPKKGANVHKVVVTDIAGGEVTDPNHADKAKVPGISVRREGWEDRENLDGYEDAGKSYGSSDHRAREYPPMTFEGLVEDAEVRRH